MSLLKVGHEIVRSETRGNKRKLVASKEGKEENFLNRAKKKTGEKRMQRGRREKSLKVTGQKEKNEWNSWS